MIRIILSSCALAALAACQPAIPDSAAGVGFDNDHMSAQAQAERDAQLSGTALPSPQAVSGETIPSAPSVAAAPLATTQTAQPAQPPVATASSEASDIARETQAALSAAAANSGQQPIDASPSNPAPQVFSNPGISDENDFAAVEDRRSIEADAAQRERNKAQYQVVEAGAVPTRTGNAGPNIVAYALSTTNPKGTKIFNRIGLKSASKYEANCAKYPSPDLAQIEFLERGGPKRDRLGLDPDGDGYACAWDPAPFRKVSGN